MKQPNGEVILTPGEKELITAFFVRAWSDDLSGDPKGRDKFLTEAIRSLIRAGFCLFFSRTPDVGRS